MGDSFERPETGPSLSETDRQMREVLDLEIQRERERINLIASENYASIAVLEAQGSVLTNKYAEGYPGRRYYAGCEYVDMAESIAIERAKELFGSDHANVQPHSGTQANMAAYLCVLRPGDTIMAMDLSCGGHLSHGAAFNFSGVFYRAVYYGVDRRTERIDYDRVAEVAKKERPRLIIAGGSSYPLALDFQAFREIADGVGAVLMVDMAHFGGLVAGGVHPDPVPFADLVTSTTHKTLRGPRGGLVLARARYAEKLDSAVFPGAQGGPFMHTIAAKAVCFKEAMSPDFRRYQQMIVENSRAICAKLANEGFRMVAGGTETHLCLADLRPQGMSGHEASLVLDSVKIDVNKNEIPYDETPPTVTSGIRIGTPSVTTRGMGPGEMEILGGLIARALKNRHDDAVLDEIRESVGRLAEAFPVYPGL